ncbi:metabotropic glutamate receptor 2-like [Gigantopelta aegis]|uniref:metabotropic glutamate receptor 2-like n=1 Tax=Gigantopelta aegis TaxID=1735272 RepID=UPI001B88E355|nr:metabotropic glutamate receptor 2-like [Gigantopelta aegis]
MLIVGGVMLLVCLSSAQEKCGSDTVSCVDSSMPILRTSLSGTSNHYYIGGLFGVHEKGMDAYECSDDIRLRGLQNMQAFFWAINYYQQNLTLKENPNGPVVNSKVSVGGVAFDSCGRQEQVINNIMGFAQCRTKPIGVDRRQLLAFVGPDRSTEAMAAAELLQDMNLTSVSHAATASKLGNAEEYPYFLRTVPSNKNDAMALAAILGKVVRTKYVQLVYQDNAYGRDGKSTFEWHAKYSKICIVQSMAVDENYQEVINKLMDNSTIQYVVLFADAQTAKNILNAAQRDNPAAGTRKPARKVLIFLGTSSWGKNKDVIKQAAEASENSIVMAHSVQDLFKNDIDAFTNYWRNLKPVNQLQTTLFTNPWFVKYWEDTWGCKVTGNNSCDLNSQTVKDTEIDAYVPYTIIAVRSIIEGIFKAATDACTGTYELCTLLMNIRNRGPTIFYGIKRFQAEDGKFYYDQSLNPDKRYKSGDVAAKFSNYEVYRVVSGQYLKLGDWNPDKMINPDELINFDSRKYEASTCPEPCPACDIFRTTTPPTTPGVTRATAPPTTADSTQAGNYTIIKFPADQVVTGAYPITFTERTAEEYMTRFEVGQRWIIALGVMAGLGVLIVIMFEIYILYRLLGTRMGHRWRTMWLGQLLLFGIFLCYMTLFAYILIPTKATCGIIRFGVGVSYAFCFAVLLVKLMVILTSKSSKLSFLPGDVESPNYLKGVYQFLMFMFAVGIQIVIDAQWLITVPPEAIRVVSNNGTNVWICNHYTWTVKDGYHDMRTFVRNGFENHLMSLVYVMFLILITTLLAAKAHGISTNHRESVFIGIAAGFSIPIWLAWSLVGGLNRDHLNAHEFCDGCMAFGLFVTATCVLFTMFVPKIQQLVHMSTEGLYLDDDRDTYYAESVIVPPSYKSKTNSVIYVNNQGIYSEPITVGDPLATHLRHPGSTYSTTNPHLYKKAQSEYATQSGRVIRVTPELTGKYTVNRKAQSEIAYGTRSAKGTLRRSRYGSQQNLGAL